MSTTTKNGEAKGLTKTQSETGVKKKSENLPAFRVFAEVPNGGRGTRIGNCLGAIFNHGNGEGATIILDSHPIANDGQIRMVMFPVRAAPVPGS